MIRRNVLELNLALRPGQNGICQSVTMCKLKVKYPQEILAGLLITATRKLMVRYDNTSEHYQLIKCLAVYMTCAGLVMHRFLSLILSITHLS